MAENKFDPEAVREFQRTAREKLLDPIENTLMPMFESGNVLNREPRWGQLPSAAAAQGTYSGYHSAVWQALEKSRQDLYGMLERLDENIEAYAESEDATATEHQTYEGQL